MPRKKTHQEYCEEISNFNNKIKVIENYKGSSIPIKHKCPICEQDWFVRPSDILSSKATKCNKCSGNYLKTQEEYIIELKQINNKIEVIEEYQGAHIPILHKCPLCNEDWLVEPNIILNRKAKGCNKCRYDRMKIKLSKTHEDYLDELQKMNINIKPIKKYINANKKIAHECPVCKRKDWLVRPNDILIKGVRVCNKCKKNATNTHEDYLNILNERNINIEVLEEYKGYTKSILHRCPDCGRPFNIQPASIISKRTKRCHDCRKTKLKTHDEYMKEVNFLEIPVKVIDKYINCHTPIFHKCVICGREDWLVTPNSILSGQKMCNDCRNKQIESLHATVLKQIWKHHNPNVVWEDPSCINPKTKRSLETDIVDHELKISVEIQSDYHDNEKQKRKDKFKKEYWESQNYKHFQLDIRDYTILEIINIFFPNIKRIPDWIDLSGKTSSRNWSILEAQRLLDEGNTIKKIAEKLGTTSTAISSAIFADLLIKPDTYKNDITHLKKSIVQLNLDGYVIKEYEAIRDVENFGFNSSSIVYACKGKYKNGSHKHKGFFWYYKSDYEQSLFNRELKVI